MKIIHRRIIKIFLASVILIDPYGLLSTTKKVLKIINSLINLDISWWSIVNNHFLIKINNLNVKIINYGLCKDAGTKKRISSKRWSLGIQLAKRLLRSHSTHPPPSSYIMPTNQKLDINTTLTNDRCSPTLSLRHCFYF